MPAAVDMTPSAPMPERAPDSPPATPMAAETSTGEATSAGGSTDEEPHSTEVREAVAAFSTKEQFRQAVKRLLAAGFAPTDLSVLASHDSLEVAGGVPAYRGSPGEALMAGLTDEVNFIEPLQVAGFSALTGGPIAAGISAAVVAAGLGGMALKELVERFVANRHSADFAAALEDGDGVLLWVRVADPAEESKALAILDECGGADPHLNTRLVM